MSVYAYIRGNSEEAVFKQKELIDKFSFLNFFSVDSFFEDMLVSGVSENRPGYIGLKGVLRQGDAVVVTDFSRLSRNPFMVQEFLSLLKNVGVSLKVIDIDFDSLRDDFVYETFLFPELVDDYLKYQKISSEIIDEDYSER